jgi:hypothetical protein
VIVGLSGYARVGKDTVGAFLVAEHGFRRVAFADELRSFLYDLNPLIPILNGGPNRVAPLVDALGWDLAKQRDEVRALLQRIGTECVRKRDPDFWIRTALRDVDDRDDIVITDVRFPNEARAVLDRCGVMLRIERPYYRPLNEHPSETALDDWSFDAVIANNGSLEDLGRAVERAVLP